MPCVLRKLFDIRFSYKHKTDCVRPLCLNMSLDKICISKRAINFHPSISLKQMESLVTIADNLEPSLRRINMRHRRKTKKLTLVNQIILSFKHEALHSNIVSNNYNLLLSVSLVIIIIIIITICPRPYTLRLNPASDGGLPSN